MAKGLKRHVQQEIRWVNKAGDLRGTKREAGKGRGKHRRGRPPTKDTLARPATRERPRVNDTLARPATRGRPRRAGAGEWHKVRPALKASQPVHVTLRTVREVGRLRTAAVYRAVREAMIVMLGRDSCRIVQLSIQHNHVHLLVEAQDRMALARGMQGFQISAAKHINAEISKGRIKGISWYEAKRRGLIPADRERRKGTVFVDRYHAEIIATPRQARNAIAYVFNNWRKHREHRDEVARGWVIDPYATGWSFDGWKEREGEAFVWKLRETYKPMPTWRPKTWLLSEGWRRYGLVSTHEVPGPRGSVSAS